MILMFAALAFAADPDDAAAEAISLEVHMEPVEVRGQVLRTGIWSRVPDAMAVELALTEHAVRLEDASVVTASFAEKRTTLRWMELFDGRVNIEKSRRGKRRVCSAPSAGGIWKGGTDIVIYEPTASQRAALVERPSMLLVEDHPDVGAMVSLTPGDTVTVVDVRHKKRLIKEVVSVSRASGVMKVERRVSGERLCFVP